MRTNSIFQSFLAMAVAMGLFSCQSKPAAAPPVEPVPVVIADENSVWSMLARGDEKAKGFFIGEIDVHAKDKNGKTPLHYAAERDDNALALFFIAMGAEVEAEDNDKQTPLGICADKGHAATAKVIVEAGANIHNQAGHSASPAVAAMANNAFLTAILTPASVESADSSGYTILHIASEAGNVPAVRAILASVAGAAGSRNNVLDKKDSKGNNPLDIVLSRPDSHSHIEAAELLILSGSVSANPIYTYFAPAARVANYDLRRVDGNAPLHFAAAEGYGGLISFLLEKNANSNIKNASGATPLHEAVRSGKINAIKLLIDGGADINAQDARGNSVLHIAAPPQHHIEVIQIFLEKGINPNLRDEHGDTPLHVLITLNREPEIVNALFADNGIDVSVRNITGQTPLFIAARDNRIALIPILLSKGSDIFAADNFGITPFDHAIRIKGSILDVFIIPETAQNKDSSGNTMLHIAVRNHADAFIIGKILDQKVNVNARNRDGDTALHIAARMNLREAGEYIISRGADIFSSNSAGENPLYIALTHRSGVLQWMFNVDTTKANDGLGNTMLHYVASWGMDRYIPYVIQRGASTEAVNSTGETPLFWAVRHDGASTVRTLLASRANINARDSLGNSVLHAAVRWNAQNAAVALLDGGTDVNVQSVSRTTPLHDTVRLGNIEMAVILIEWGADLEVRDSNGNTPFMEAVRSGYVAAVNLLAGRGADPMTRNVNGDTPLHLAVSMEDNTMIGILLNLNVSIHARNTRNRSPFQVALNNSPSVASTLLTRDRINSPDDMGNSPLHIAVQERVPASTLRTVLNRGTRITAIDSNGRIPLRLAAELDEWELAKVLADAGSDPFLAAVDTRTTGEITLSKGADAIRAVFSARALYSVDASGNTILHYAARMGNPESILLLLELGASKDVRNISSESPADVAARWNRQENAFLLN